MGLSSYVLLLLAACLAVSSSPQKSDEDQSNAFMKRDYKAPSDVPAQGYPPVDGPDNGYYYYYYPVEEDGHKQLKKEKDSCSIDKLLVPLILITIFLGIMAANAIGLLPAIALPALVLPALPALPAIQFPNKGRDIAGFAYEYIPWGSLEKMTTSVMEAVESDECLSRLVCESGRYAEGRQALLSLLEFFTPPKYINRMKIFKDSALKKSDCSHYKCSYAEEKKL